MRFFTYSPLDMSEAEAYKRAERCLNEFVIVHVTHQGLHLEAYAPGERPRALPETYLVRVEQDGSLRIVEKALS